MPTKTVNLRDMPEDLVRRAKASAALSGVSLKAFVIRALEQALTPPTDDSAGRTDKKDKKDKKRKKDRKR